MRTRSTIHHSLHGQLTNEIQNGVTIARTYDALNRPTGYILMQNGGASPPGEPFAVSYAYDPIGNRLSATEYAESGDALVSAYSANALNQYTQRTVPGTAQVRGFADSDAEVTVNGNGTWRNGEYFYGGDDADNSALPVFKEVAIEALRPAATPDDYDEIAAVTGRVFVAQTPEQFTYDADGNMTCDGRFRYTWNAENRLVRAQKLVAPTNRHPYTITYAYDHKGRMVTKRITENDGSDTLVKSIAYIWDGWNIIREIQWPVALIKTGDLASSFTHHFSTKPWCPVTGLYEYQMRKYRPGIGRWLSRDPIGVIGNALLYAFCKNQPIRIVDGLGLTEVVSPVPFPGGTYSNSDYRYHLIIDDSWSNSVKLLQQTSSQYINREMDKCIEELQQHERNDKCRSINYESEFDTEFFEGENEPLDYYFGGNA